MDNITALSAINLLPSTKEQVKDFSQQIINSVKNGDTNPLKLKAQLKFIEQTLATIEPEIKEEVLTEASKYGKSFEAFGYKIEVSENLGVKYDYSECGDIEYNSLDEKIKALTEEKKKREKWLQNCAFNVECVDKETGETYTVNPPIKKSTTGLIMKAI